ncbi:MAG: hypothetical protein WAL50_14545 [Kineosporiaceae bacterium]
MSSTHWPTAHVPHRHRPRTASTRPTAARAVRIIALTLTALVAVLGGMFIIGNTMAEPGGLAGVGLVALWLLPTVALAALVEWRLDTATPVLTAATVALVVLSSWAAVPSVGWNSFEDAHGPVRAIIAVALTGVIGLLGWYRPRMAGWLLVTVAASPFVGVVLGAMLSAFLGTSTEWSRISPSLQVASAPALVIGALYLLSTLGSPGRRSSS